ncbi:MAG: ATP-binding cassette domain-containing protein [bacterium]
MAKSNNAFIVCDNLVKIYRIGEAEVMALQGLDLAVSKGELMAVVGASGSGKTTLLNILGGLDRPTAGNAIVNGMNLLKMSNAALNHYRREQVGFVWQQTSRNLIPYLTALENVELPMILAGKSQREKRVWARELLDAVGLGKRIHHKLAQMSGGEQQRVAIAVALANRPILLLADEPTGEVDTATARTILETFRRLNEAYGLTTIIVTHDYQISNHVDRVVAIRDGKTSIERIRHVQPPRPKGEPQEGPTEGDGAQSAEYREYVVLDSAGRLQIPPEYREKLNIGDRVELDLLEGGILIRPVSGRGMDRTGEEPLDEGGRIPPGSGDNSAGGRRSLLKQLKSILGRADGAIP